MATLMPKDDDNNVIPALRLKQGGAHIIDATTTAARNAVDFHARTKVVSIYATGAVYLKFGDASVAAGTSDHYFPQGIYYDFAISGGGSKGPHYARVSARAVDGTCKVYISEKE